MDGGNRVLRNRFDAQSIVFAPREAILAGKTEEEVNPMKIAVSSTGPELHDLVDPRFGRCRYYILYDESTGLHESKENTAGMH